MCHRGGEKLMYLSHRDAYRLGVRCDRFPSVVQKLNLEPPVCGVT